ncbi:hypothetical protein GH714_029974 [Hevea brasiliensis]|uniref:fructose-bisphosphate aldolase n=1 Tax=Hevea brasiliensis TaxID=3981 RepID=A0A6A6M1R9_HEVBR|nr:hypothetical protein GH714_029974 [Hevea brasiliensis]
MILNERYCWSVISLQRLVWCFDWFLDYIYELIANAAYIGTPGKGILAADESTGTIGKRLASINVENVEDNRRALRELLFTTPGKPFVDILKEGGVLPGIKVDKGTVELAGTNGETTTQGLDGLGQRCQKYYEAGARFAKWRAVLRLAPMSHLSLPSTRMQMDWPDMPSSARRMAWSLLWSLRSWLMGLMTLTTQHGDPGSESKKVAPEVIAEYTVRALQRTVPAAVPAIVFLSGGQSEEEATLNLNAMNRLKTKKPWSLSFSFGRALQQSTLKAWAGKEENVKKAQDAFLVRCKANSEATLGTYKGDATLGEGAAESLHVKDYKY